MRALKAADYPLLQNARRDLMGARAGATDLSQADIGLFVRQVPRTGPALVDQSLASRGFATATTDHSVELSWIPEKPSLSYAVTRGETVIGRVSGPAGYFADTSVQPGHTYQYRVAPIVGAGVHESWGTTLTTPARAATSSGVVTALNRTAAARLAARVAAPTTTLSWMTFIPQKFVTAPPAGCSYGSKYKFGGDNHGFDWTSSKYRTAVHAVIDWKTQTVHGHTAVGATHVYRKSDGKLVAVKTASAKNMWAKAAGGGKDHVNIVMQNTAHNPFCSFGSISGGINITISMNGSWAIHSGSIRRMPNHLIYIYNGGKVTTVWKQQYANMYCLVGPAMCDVANLTGYQGAYK